MKPIHSVVIIGLGAIGTIYAAKLQAYDPGCLRVLVDEERYARYRREGILLNGERLDFNYVLPDPLAEAADLVLIATKSGGLPAALEMLKSFVGEQTLILPLLNGITSEAVTAAAFGWEKVLYALFLGHFSARAGNAVSFDGTGTIVFGEAENTQISERVGRVRDFFERAGIGYQIPADMLHALWRKFMINMGMNQASAVLGASYAVFQRRGAARELAVGLMQEVVQAAQRAGIRGTGTMLASGLELIDGMLPETQSSMLQDVEAGRPTEVDLFAQVVGELGRKHGVPTPLNDAFLQIILALEQVKAQG